MKFINPLSFETMGKCEVYTDIFKTSHENVWHIELPKWADVFLIAPLSANTMAKMANGIADNFLTASFLACDKDVIVAPSMNTNMLNNEASQNNIRILKERNVKFIDCNSGLLACNTKGDGRLKEPYEIVDYLENYFTKKDLLGKKIIVTAGATIEPIDYVRYITNHSSGKMGYNIAKQARNRGADVVLISGNANPFEIEGIKKIDIKTNEQLKNAIDDQFDNCDCLIMAAAPCDYKPVKTYDKKLKKNGSNLNIEMTENIDILKYFGAKKKDQMIIGFAAETDDLIENAKKKLVKKNADYIIANDLKNENAGFAVDTNQISIISKEKIKRYPVLSKKDTADIILDLVGD